MHFGWEQHAQDEFCCPCQIICGFHKIFISYIWRHWLLWVLGHSQFPWLWKSGVSRIQCWAFFFERTGSNAAMSSYCSAHCVIWQLFNCASAKKFNSFNTIPWAGVYFIHSTPNNFCDYHRRNKITKLPLVFLDWFPKPYLKHISVLMWFSWPITVSLKAQN